MNGVNNPFLKINKQKMAGFSEDYLDSLLSPDEASLSLSERKGRNISLAKSGYWYGRLSKVLRSYFISFENMIERAKVKKLDCDFKRGPNEFKRWLMYIGPHPEGMKQPSVGRFDHSKGYVEGNFRWQERADNHRENIRNLNKSDLMIEVRAINCEASRARAMPKEMKEKIRKANTGRKHTPEARDRMSKAQKDRWRLIDKEARAKWGAKLIGNSHGSANLGQKRSEETKRKLSEARLRYTQAQKSGGNNNETKVTEYQVGSLKWDD